MRHLIECHLDVISERFNRSFEWEPSIGTSVDGRAGVQYDGCLGSIQRNVSDVVAGHVAMPVMGHNLRHTIVDGSQRMAILSSAKQVREIDRPSQVLDMMSSFRTETWVTVSALLIMLFWLMTARLRLMLKSVKQSRRQACSLLLPCILKQLSACKLPHKGPHVKLIFMVTVLLMCFTAFFLTSMIKTDIVVVDLPFTINSYEDLLQSRRRPLWFALMSDSRVFQEAPADSVEQRVWQRALIMGLNQSLLPSSPPALFAAALAGFNMTAVFVSTDVFARVFMRFACFFKIIMKFGPDVSGHLAIDPNSLERLLVSVRHARMSPVITQVMERRRQYMFQAGLLLKSISLIDYQTVMRNEAGLESDHASADIDDCCSNAMHVLARHAPISLPLFHYRSLVCLTSAVTAVAGLILLIERRREKDVCNNRRHRMRMMARKRLSRRRLATIIEDR